MAEWQVAGWQVAGGRVTGGGAASYGHLAKWAVVEQTANTAGATRGERRMERRTRVARESVARTRPAPWHRDMAGGRTGTRAFLILASVRDNGCMGEFTSLIKFKNI